MSNLTGTEIKDTYGGVLNIGPAGLTGSLSQVTDGEGNVLPFEVSNTTVNFTGIVTGALVGPTGPTGADTAFVNINEQTISYTLVLSDAGRAVTMTSASNTIITVPLNSSVAFPVGTQILFVRGGTGAVGVTGDVGVTINSAQAFKNLNYQNSGATLLKTATDTFFLFGDLKA